MTMKIWNIYHINVKLMMITVILMAVTGFVLVVMKAICYLKLLMGIIYVLMKMAAIKMGEIGFSI